MTPFPLFLLTPNRHGGPSNLVPHPDTPTHFVPVFIDTGVGCVWGLYVCVCVGMIVDCVYVCVCVLKRTGPSIRFDTHSPDRS